MVVSPIAQLKEIETRSLAKKSQLPATARRFNEWRGVGFRIGRQEVVASMDNIVEILEPVICTRVPSSTIWFDGIANVRGQLVPVTDLYSFLMGERQQPNRDMRVVVFRLTNTLAGLGVSAVTGIRNFREDTLSHDLPDEITEHLRPFLVGSFHRAGDDFPVFDFNRLVSNERFMHIVEIVDNPSNRL